MTKGRRKKQRRRKASSDRATASEPVSTPGDSTPGDSTPGDSTPGDSTPGDSTPTPVDGARWNLLRWVGLAVFFTAVAVALTWPLAKDLGAGIPLGTEPVATVPLFNLWTLAWNVESAGRGYDGYWQAPIFHPTPDSFALSEPQPVLGWIAWLICGLGASILTAYNLILIGTLAVNGALTTALLRVAGLTWIPAVCGGLLVSTLPFTHQELGVLQLVPLAGVLAFGIAVLRFTAEPGWKWGAALGLGLALAYGLSSQVAVFGALAVTPAFFWLAWPLRSDRRAWAGLGLGIVVFGLLVSPLALAQMRATADEGFVRSVETVKKHSALPGQYFKSPWPSFFPTPGIETAERPSARAFWPGTLRVLSAMVALILAWRSTTCRRLAVAAFLLLSTSLLLSFGAHLQIAGFSMVETTRSLPGIGQIRSFFRFALFAQLATVLLSATALYFLQLRVRRRLLGPGAAAVVAAVGLVIVLDGRPSMGKIEPLPSLDLELPWLSWIEQHAEAHEVLAFVPFPEGRNSKAYLGTSQWMFWQMRHWRPMVNGYSGFFPGSFRKLKKTMQAFPSNDSLLALRDAGVRYCVVHRRFIERSPAPDPNGPVQLAQVFRDEQHALAIFELR